MVLKDKKCQICPKPATYLCECKLLPEDNLEKLPERYFCKKEHEAAYQWRKVS